MKISVQSSSSFSHPPHVVYLTHSLTHVEISGLQYLSLKWIFNGTLLIVTRPPTYSNMWKCLSPTPRLSLDCLLYIFKNVRMHCWLHSKCLALFKVWAILLFRSWVGFHPVPLGFTQNTQWLQWIALCTFAKSTGIYNVHIICFLFFRY